MPQPTGIADLPGFEESLRLLVHREQYSLTDIAAMFGVSRERIRQLCAVYAIPTPARAARGLFSLRVWDDATHRFVAVPRGAWQHGEVLAAQQRRAATRAARLARRAVQCRTCFDQLRTTLGRTPTLAEWASAVFGRPFNNQGAGQYLIAYLAPRGRLADVYALTGATPRPPGHYGHRAPRRRHSAPVTTPCLTTNTLCTTPAPPSPDACASPAPTWSPPPARSA